MPYSTSPLALLEATTLPMLGAQGDIRYVAAPARGVLNPPEATGMPYWTINPYVGCAFGCAYCYARYAHRYVAERAAASEALDAGTRDDLRALPPWLAFERRIFVKENASALLRERLAARGGRARLERGATILIGSATDPYQPAERRFRLTRGLLEVLSDVSGLVIGLITKSPLVTRDVDLLARIAQRSRLSLHVTITTPDRDLARRLEPRAPTPEARLRTVVRLAEAGLDVGVNVMPVMPGITDAPRMLDTLVARAARAGATRIGACVLRLRREARDRYLPMVEAEFPHLADRYRATYAHSHQAGDRYREGLRAFMRRACERHGIAYGGGRRKAEGGRENESETESETESENRSAMEHETSPRERAVQLPLALNA